MLHALTARARKALTGLFTRPGRLKRTHPALPAPGPGSNTNCADLIHELRGSMVDGYDPDDVNQAFARIEDACGVRLVCLWDYYDAYGFGGNSQFYVEDDNGRLHELAGDLWQWLNDDPDAPSTPAFPGTPASWWGAPADLPTACAHDRFHNYAVENRDNDH